MKMGRKPDSVSMMKMIRERKILLSGYVSHIRQETDFHVGHWRICNLGVWSRCKLQRDYYIIHPMGWDAFGLPAEITPIKMKAFVEVLFLATI